MIAIHYEPHPVHEGWMTWKADSPHAFHNLLGDTAVRAEGPGRARVRWWPAQNLGNPLGGVHGGAIMAFADVALFAGARSCGIVEAATSATVECSCQFLAPASAGEPIDVVVELLRETRRMAFLRGTFEQGGTTLAAISGIIRKIAQ
jgi:uncharacterized protein (TIGR00369 family)